MEENEQDDDEVLDPLNLVKPTQQSLDLIVSDVHSIQVCRWEQVGESLEPSAVLTIDDRPRLQELHHYLEIVESDDFFHCMCVGSLVLQLLAREGVVATLTVHHGRSIRWHDAWGSDATLRDGWGLARWLAGHGATSLLEEMESAESEAVRQSQLFTAWWDAMPACLQSLYERATDWPEQQPLARMLATLQAEYRTDVQLVLTLCEWHGTLGSAWGSYFVFETLAERLLDELGRDRVVTALQGADPSRRQAEGAARYLIYGTRTRDIPGRAAEVLRACGAALDDPEKVERIRRLIGD